MPNWCSAKIYHKVVFITFTKNKEYSKSAIKLPRSSAKNCSELTAHFFYKKTVFFPEPQFS